jgi:hypothetical protein
MLKVEEHRSRDCKGRSDGEEQHNQINEEYAMRGSEIRLEIRICEAENHNQQTVRQAGTTKPEATRRAETRRDETRRDGTRRDETRTRAEH